MKKFTTKYWRIILYLTGVTGVSMADAKGEAAFHAKFKDGIVLCELMNKLQPGIIKKFNKKAKMPFMQMENIGLVNEAMRAYGVKSDYLFVTVDLFEKQNLNQVLIGLRDLGTKATAKGVTPAIKI